MTPSLPQLILPIPTEKSPERLTRLGRLLVVEELARALGLGEFAESGERAIPQGKRIYFRSDRAAYPAKVIQHYSQPGRSFPIPADWDQAVRRKIGNLPATAWTAYRTAEGIATDREIAETVHTMNGTEQAFRWIVLRWRNPEGKNSPRQTRSRRVLSGRENRRGRAPGTALGGGELPRGTELARPELSPSPQKSLRAAQPRFLGDGQPQ